MISLNETGPSEPNPLKKGEKKQGNGYQHPEDVKTYEDKMTEINDDMDLDNRTALDAIKKNRSS